MDSDNQVFDALENMKQCFREFSIKEMRMATLTFSVYRILRDEAIEAAHNERPSLRISYRIAMALKIAEQQGYERCDKEWTQCLEGAIKRSRLLSEQPNEEEERW